MTSLRFRKMVVPLFLVCAAAALGAETVPPRTFFIPSARMAALGGSHAALGDDLSALTNNPAGLYGARPRFHIAELSLALQGPIFSIANIALRGAAGEDMDDLLTDPAVTDFFKSVFVGAHLIGPLSFGYVGKGLGFSLVNSTGLELVSRGSTTFAVAAVERAALHAGYAFRVHLPDPWESALDIGVNLKAFLEGKNHFSRTLLEIPDLFSDGAGSFLDNPFSLTTGFGLDLGLRWTYRDNLMVGLVGRDVFTPTTRSDYATLSGFLGDEVSGPAVHGRVPTDLSLGVMYRPPLGQTLRYLGDLKLLLDYRDILDFLTHPDSTVNPLLKFGLGAEIRVLGALQLRAGLSEGLPAWGFGLDYGVVKMHFAMFGAEMSSEPGMRPVFNIILGLEISL